MRNESLYRLLAVLLLAVSIAPIGVAAWWLGFVHGESPCVLCWQQRTAMALVGLVCAFILRFGPRPRYIGLGLLIAAHGLYMGVRHSALHWVRDVGQGFAGLFFGAHTYTWSAFIFWVFVVAIALLLLAMRDGAATAEPRDPGPLGRLAIGVFLFAIAGNVIQAFASTGPPPYMGQSDPVRFSFDPATWVWSLEEWEPSPVSLRGRYDVEKPSLAGLEADPARGPLRDLPRLAPKSRTQIAAALDGAPADLAWEGSTGRFLVTTDRHQVAILDASLARVLNQVRVDPGFSVSLGDGLPGVAWLDPTTVAALGENKSYVVLAENEGADRAKNWRFFLAGGERFEERSRGRFATVRARMNYVGALAFDAAGRSLYTVTVPSRRYKKLVVSRFDRRDMTLSEEFLPALGAGLALAAEGRALDEYFVTGIAVEAGRLHALSAAFSTLLEIDLATHEVVAAHALDGVTRPTGLALRDGEWLVLGEDGTVTTFAR
ncbi:MAG: disulfide bond formation protein B [Vicinamibacteria bacterium]|nr:disulfide bond formation protein B [Vicinamibacteria bacterium]